VEGAGVREAARLDADEVPLVAHRVRPGEHAVVEVGLTPREKDVLREALTGARIADIAAELHLTQRTVRNHLSSAIAKTHTSTRGEAAREAQVRGWL